MQKALSKVDVSFRSETQKEALEIIIEAERQPLVVVMPIQKCRIERVRIRFSPHTNSVRVTATKGAFDSGRIRFTHSIAEYAQILTQQTVSTNEQFLYLPFHRRPIRHQVIVVGV